MAVSEFSKQKDCLPITEASFPPPLTVGSVRSRAIENMVKSSGTVAVKIDQEEFQKSMKKPLVKVRRKSVGSKLSFLPFFLSLSPSRFYFAAQYSDMPTEMGNEAVEVCTTTLDKFQANRDYEGASAVIKNTLDKKFGPSWQCAIGEGFGFEISCQQKFLLHLYYGKVGVLCYKS